MSFLATLRGLATPSPTRSEADIQSDVKALLVAGDFLDGEPPLLESQTGDGTARRIDIEYGALVIECKKEVDATKRTALADAEAQLASYLAIREAQSGDLYSGILTDGVHWRHQRLTSDGSLGLCPHLRLDLIWSLTDRFEHGSGRRSPPRSLWCRVHHRSKVGSERAVPPMG